MCVLLEWLALQELNAGTDLDALEHCDRLHMLVFVVASDCGPLESCRLPSLATIDLRGAKELEVSLGIYPLRRIMVGWC